MNTRILDPESRRVFIERWAKATLGVTVLHGTAGQMLAAESKTAVPLPSPGKGKNLIFLNLIGGMSHIDTLDPKEGPTQGPGKPIKTKAGFQLGEIMSKLAGQADKISLIRSMTSKLGTHSSAQYFIRTGYEQRTTIMHPTLGAWAQHFKGPSHPSLPSSVCVNRNPNNANGFFPASHSPLPVLDPDVGLQNSQPAVEAGRFTKRMAFLDRLDGEFRHRFQTASVKSYTDFYKQTVALMGSPDLKAFSIAGEPAAVREKYGKTRFGSGCLLARHLIESGVRCVEVASDGWDMHGNIAEGLHSHGAEMDQAVAALLDDLGQRGLLESTIVALCTEFGRGPVVNVNGGRDHYPKVFSTMLAGGSIKRGYVHGASDKGGYEVADQPVTVQDLLSTIGHAMGLPVDEVTMSPSNRPFTIGDKGKVITDLFA
ncbi:MAG TPA: DUF1501 domain-containing protein [Verrucomicrobiales bacterium]|nr:DUF1501 domain-containing protein [Verrucomicrobiales bacterium]HRJ07236.1 DUF1501 domain-containing protein [Prosthecobacter sp.]HRK14805.1 DUF1501 domain-containing protein [Prosthecobacter sp.]